MNCTSRKRRERRAARAFDRALRAASPAMEQELPAAATHTTGIRIN